MSTNYNEKIIDIQDYADGLRSMLNDYLQEAQQDAEGGNLEGSSEGMVWLLDVLGDIKSQVRDIDNEANPSLVTVMDKMGQRNLEYSSISVERRVSNYRSNWQNDVLVRAVINSALDEIQPREYVDQETGEPIHEREIVAPWMDAVVDRLLECAAFRDWRVTALRNNIPGLNPDNFCDVKRSIKAVLRRSK
tara:strand:+ start:325 stop:897 length:573 start_codon:yes stop_codon:yes gene_type:complete